MGRDALSDGAYRPLLQKVKYSTLVCDNLKCDNLKTTHAIIRYILYHSHSEGRIRYSPEVIGQKAITIKRPAPFNGMKMTR
jgi:hypothetical protein